MAVFTVEIQPLALMADCQTIFETPASNSMGVSFDSHFDNGDYFFGT